VVGVMATRGKLTFCRIERHIPSEEGRRATCIGWRKICGGASAGWRSDGGIAVIEMRKGSWKTTKPPWRVATARDTVWLVTLTGAARAAALSHAASEDMALN